MMTLYRRSTLAQLSLALLILILAVTACSSDDDQDSDSVPTLAAASITPPPTRTQVGMLLSPTPFTFMTSTPFQTGLQPTSTQLVLQPIAPTWTPPPFVPTATSYPYDVRIMYPVDGSQIAGYVTVIGYASHPRFVQYALEWGPDPNPGNLWYPITSPPVTRIVYPQGALGAWNTTQVADGNYQIRLHIWLNDGTDVSDVVTGIRVSNTRATAVPTNTPTPRPNRPPTINLIPGQTVNAGDRITLPVTVSDPDGDAVNIFVSSDNPAIANVQVTGPAQVSIRGRAAGTATITVTANDNLGGSAMAGFVVTVQGQNRPPNVSLIPNQTLDLGQAANLPLTVTDPDGNSLAVTAVSDNSSAVRVNTPDQNTVRIIGDAAGSANVTVTVDDGSGGVASISFQVIVQSANQPPTVQGIPAQAMNAGDQSDVTYTASDPEGDPLTATATSDNGAVVSASVTTPGVITLVANGGGSANVTLSVSDGVNPAVATVFAVNVTSPNQPPTVDPIQPQTMNVGDTLDVTFTAVDPESDPLTATATSDNGAVVSANVNNPGVITLVANSGGTANVTLSVSDNNNAPVNVIFAVNIISPNQPPTVDPIQPQAMNVGDTLDVTFNAVDPEGDSLTATAASDNDAVVSASVTAPGTITLAANGGGIANITLNVSDGNNAPVIGTFTVNVTSPNQPPTVDPIQPQAMNVGATLDVTFNAADSEGDPITASATSDNEAVVSASVNNPGVITLVANSGGTANITLSVSDGVNPAVTTVLAVTVAAPNQPPTIDPIMSQTMNLGATLDVTYNAVDPEGDPLTATVTSDNETAISASVNTPGVITLVANSGGTANITLSASDGINPPVTTAFTVSAAAANTPPEIQPVPEQALRVGEEIAVSVMITDADLDPIVLTAISQNPGVVTASAVGTDTVMLQGVAEGTTTIELTADDSRGGVTNAAFNVNVSSAPPTFDLMAYPVLPDIPQSMAQMLSLTYQSGLGLGNRAGVFSKVGDDPINSQNFMVPFATSEAYKMGSFTSLQSTIDFFASTPVREAIDPAINSFNVDSVAAGDGFGIDSLTQPAPAEPPCDGSGTVLGCELNATHPSIALISFSAPNVTYMDPSQFRSELQALVVESMSTYGVIPVLVTIPADNGYSTEQLTEYNRAIVEVATQTGIPLWNLWRVMQERGITDPYSVAPEGPATFTDPALNFGFNIRNLTALQVLETVCQAAGIQ